MRLLIIVAIACLALSAMPTQVVGYSVEPRLASFNDGGELAAQAAVAAAAAQQARSEFMKRFLPAKERRAPLEGFEDMSGFLRTIDGIQKPRFG